MRFVGQHGLDRSLVRQFDERGAADPVDPNLLAAEAYIQAAGLLQRAGRKAGALRLRAQAALLLAGCEGARTPIVAEIDPPRLTRRERDITQHAATVCPIRTSRTGWWFPFARWRTTSTAATPSSGSAIGPA
jgi:hypothetical protein